MSITLIAVGKMKEKPYRQMADEYLKRLSRYGKVEEIIELCKVVAKYDGIYTTHMRSEADHLLDSITALEKELAAKTDKDIVLVVFSI